MQNQNHSQHGFTIVEMLIVLSIMSLAMLMANTLFITFRESSMLNRAARAGKRHRPLADYGKLTWRTS